MVFLAVARNALRSVFATAVFSSFLFASGAGAAGIEEAAGLLKAGQREQALEAVNKLLAATPRDAQARFLKGIILTEQGNVGEAIEVFRRLTLDYPELPEPYNNLAVIYAAQGQYDKARAALEQSIRTHPSYATAYENLGDVYAKLASQAYDRALQLDTRNSGAQNKLALVRELVGSAPSRKPGAMPTPAQIAAVTPKPATGPVEARPAPAPAKPAAAAAKVTPPPAKPTQKPAPTVAPTKAKPATPAPVAAAKPAAPKAPAAAEKPAAGGTDAILRAVQDWAKAWSAQNVDAYLASYASSFQTPKGEPRAAWAKQRRERVSSPKSISVEVVSPRIKRIDATHASVSFRQRYRSDRFDGNTNKTLDMVSENGRWRIQQERTSR